jgi:hypothetical protein
MSAAKLLDRLRAIQAEKLVADVVARQYSESKAVSANTETDRQAQRIRRLAATVTAAELLTALQKRIKPALRKELSATELLELALTLAYADKRDRERTSDVYRPAREFYPATVYQPAKARRVTND